MLLAASLFVGPAFAARTHRAPTSGHGKKSSRRAKPHQVRGQRGISSDRAREIQSALIREKYLNGEPSGQWDQQTQDAMEKFQGDHGWQTKLTPDSRALIKLGLGPNHSDNALTVASTKSVAPSAVSVDPLPPSTMANTLAAVHSTSN